MDGRRENGRSDAPDAGRGSSHDDEENEEEEDTGYEDDNEADIAAEKEREREEEGEASFASTARTATRKDKGRVGNVGGASDAEAEHVGELDNTSAAASSPPTAAVAAAVKAAIHANASITWTGCSNIINYSRYDLLSSMLPVYEFLFDAGIQMLVYSGDVDAIVPSLGTRAWLAKLPLVEVEPIRTYTVDGQVGGWTTKYDKITFAVSGGKAAAQGALRAAQRAT